MFLHFMQVFRLASVETYKLLGSASVRYQCIVEMVVFRITLRVDCFVLLVDIRVENAALHRRKFASCDSRLIILCTYTY